MKANDDNLKFWQALYEILQDAKDDMPYSSEPDRVYWDHPDDEWKNHAELQDIEQKCSNETDELIRHYCLKQEWPRRSKNDARYFAEERLKWALNFVRIFTIPQSETQMAAIPRPSQSGWDLLCWLLIEAYHKRFPPPQKSPFYISGGSDPTVVWT